MSLPRVIPLTPLWPTAVDEANDPMTGVICAVLQQLAGELAALARRPDHVQVIDLESLPLNERSVAALKQRLGQGEVVIRVDSAATTLIEETAYAGVWWQTQGLFDPERQDIAASGRLRSIVVATVPPLVPASAADVHEAARRLARTAAEPIDPPDARVPGDAHD